MKKIRTKEVFSLTLNPQTVAGVDEVAKILGFESRSSLAEFILKKFVMEVLKDGKIPAR